MDYAERGFNDKVKAREWREVGKIASKGKIMEGWKNSKMVRCNPDCTTMDFHIGMDG